MLLKYPSDRASEHSLSVLSSFCDMCSKRKFWLSETELDLVFSLAISYATGGMVAEPGSSEVSET